MASFEGMAIGPIAGVCTVRRGHINCSAIFTSSLDNSANMNVFPYVFLAFFVIP